MSLTSSYAKAWREQYGLGLGWFVNTQPNDKIALGLKGQLHGDSFGQSGAFAALSDLVPPPSTPTDNSEWLFQSTTSISVHSDVEGQTGVNIGWLGGAKAGVKASFGTEAGVSALGTHKWFDRFPDLDAVRARLRQAVADGTLVEGDAIVVERQLTGKGVMFVSNGGQASIEATASGSIAPGAVKIADFSLDLGVTKSQGAVTMEKFDDNSVIAARVMCVGHRGMWWWRKITLFGINPISPEQQEALTFEPVEGDGDNHYFLLFDESA